MPYNVPLPNIRPEHRAMLGSVQHWGVEVTVISKHVIDRDRRAVLRLR